MRYLNLILLVVFIAALTMAQTPVAVAAEATSSTSIEQNFQKSKQNFLQKDMKAAADEIRKGAAYLKSEADAATGKGKEALMASYRELEKLAGDVEKGAVTSVKKLDAAFARSYKALATNAHVKSTEAWAKKEINNTGKNLETAADSLERGFSWTGEKMKAGTTKVIEESRDLSKKLKEDTGWASDKVSKGLKDMGKEIEQFGKRVTAK